MAAVDFTVEVVSGVVSAAWEDFMAVWVADSIAVGLEEKASIAVESEERGSIEVGLGEKDLIAADWVGKDSIEVAVILAIVVFPAIVLVGADFNATVLETVLVPRLTAVSSIIF